MSLLNATASGPMFVGMNDRDVHTKENAWAVEQAGTTIKELADKLSPEAQVLTPNSEGFKEAQIRWSDAVEKRAGVVVYVKTAEDIKDTIAWTRQHGVDFVVTGGKHSSSGASSTEGGLVIDLGHMREVTLYPETKTLRVQGGCIWRDVDEKAATAGLAMVGGTVNHTGVGGLTLGGGYGWLSGRHGLTIDNLLEATMVLADGSIKKCSKDENPDLFWAIRGAGHSFGVATEFLFQGVEQKNEIWAGRIVFNPSETLEQVVRALNHLNSQNNPDAGAAMALGPPPFLPRPGIVTTLFYNGPQEKAEYVFRELLAIPNVMKDCGMRPYCTMNSMLNNVAEYGGRKCTKGASAIYPLSPIFVSNILAEIEIFQKSLPNSGRTMINIDCYSPDKWCAVPREATAFFNRGRYQNVIIGPYWEDEAFDKIARAWARSIHARFRMEIDWRYQIFGDPAASQDIREYGNYDGTGASSQTIFGSNYPRLAQLKAQYDPDDLFNKDYAFASASRAASTTTSPTSSQPASGISTAASTAPSSPKTEEKPVLDGEKPVAHHVKFKGYNTEATGAVATGKTSVDSEASRTGGEFDYISFGLRENRSREGSGQYSAHGGSAQSYGGGNVVGEKHADGSQALSVGFEDPAAVFVETPLETPSQRPGLDELGRKFSVMDWIG